MTQNDTQHALADAGLPEQRKADGRRPTDRAPHLTPSERAAIGKAARAATPRSRHAGFETAGPRRDAVALLEQQAATRLPELVPIRYGRMLASPFAFYRGAALVMAHDLSRTATTGITVQLCGDAHLSNFGAFGSPDRQLVVDVNDFDETLPGPWEWDVKRLAASVVVASRENGFGRKESRAIVLGVVGRYRTAMREFAAMGNLDVWYSRLDARSMTGAVSGALSAAQRKRLAKGAKAAHTRDSMQALDKLTAVVDGERRIVADPPLVVPIDQMVSAAEDRAVLERELHGLIRQYRRSLQSDRRVLLEQFRVVDLAHKVVGVGSVGSRAWIVLMLGRDGQDPLFLQAKEAQPSVLAEFVGKSGYANEGHRVVAGQRLMQAASDIFLGWQRVEGIDGKQRDFYLRQLRDWKASAALETLSPENMRLYGEMCGWTLARAHARSGDRIAIAAYLGASDVFDRALADFAEAYADVNEADHRSLAAAVESGRVTAQTGV
ncbi:MAG: DUF2252 domain-containing protein [Candidatus Limnocylindrales bacterium]